MVMAKGISESAIWLTGRGRRRRGSSEEREQSGVESVSRKRESGESGGTNFSNGRVTEKQLREREKRISKYLIGEPKCWHGSLNGLS